MSEATNGVHSNVKAILDMEAAVTRFARIVVENLPNIKRELQRVTEQLEDHQVNLRAEISTLESTIAGADEDDDTSYEQQRLSEAQDELTSTHRQMRRLDDSNARYTKQACAVENLATAHTFRAKEFLTGAADDLKAYLGTENHDPERASSKPIDSISGAIDLMEEDDNFFFYASRRSDVDPDGFLDLVAHGTRDYVSFKDLELSPRELADIIRQNPKFSGQSIRLLSCSTGESRETFAQKLANELGVVVRAPNDILWVSTNGDLTIGPTSRANTGKWIDFSPKENE